LISNGNTTKGCELLKEVLQRDMTQGDDLKMVGLINKAVEELSKDGRTSPEISILVEKGLISRAQTMGKKDGNN
jgi:hypothetical protein